MVVVRSRLDRRQFLVRSAAVTASGLILPGCLPADDPDPVPEPPPLLVDPAPHENRFVGVYAGMLMLEDGRAAPFDVVAHAEARRPEIRVRLLAVPDDPHLARGLFTTEAGDGEGFYEPRYGAFSFFPGNSTGPALTLEGGLPPATTPGTVRLIVRDDGAERTLTGEIVRVSAPATTDTRILLARDLSADCNAFTGPAEMALVKTLTRGAFGSTPTTIDGTFEPTDTSQPHMRLYVNELSDTDSSFVELGQIRSSRFDSFLDYYNPDPMGGLSRGWISESGTVRLDLVDPRTWRYTMHLEAVRMRPFDGGAAGTFEVAFSGTCNVGEFELNQA